LKKEHPYLEISEHLILATDNSVNGLTDKELYTNLQKYKTELDINTVSYIDLEKIIDETEELFKDELNSDHIFMKIMMKMKIQNNIIITYGN